MGIEVLSGFSNTGMMIAAWAITAVVTGLAYSLTRLLSRLLIKRLLRVGETKGDLICLAAELTISLGVARSVMGILGLTISGTVALITVAAGAALGISAEGLIGNILSGMALRARHMFSVGDFVDLADGVRGQVVKMDNQSVLLETVDNERIFVPWAKIFDAIIVNESNHYRQGLRPLEVWVPVPGTFQEDDASRVTQVIRRVTVEFQTEWMRSWKQSRQDAFAELQNSVGYPYVVFRHWNGDSRDFYAYLLCSYQDDRLIDQLAGEIRTAIDKALIREGFEPGQTADNTNALSGELIVRSAK